jgi:hypothetical protein
MADNKFFGNENVYVDTDYDNVIVVDPNKVVNSDGTVQERNVKHENLITYANLEARVIPRTKLAIGSNYDDSVRNVGVAQLKVNFLEGRSQNQKEPNVNLTGADNEDPKYFDTSWTDQFLPGKKEGGSENDIFSSGRGVDTQLLGITRINIKMNPAFVPTVSIEMTDVQGRVLFERGDQSPYSIFMHLPYPIFILTVKGHFGKAIKLELILKDFNARFDPSDGSYKITTSYVAKSHAFLQDTLLDYIYTTPHMYPKTYEVDNNTNGTEDGTVGVDKIETTKGMQKIKEVYSLYKAKGLIDDDFPEITMNQMRMRLEYFNRFVMEAYSKEDMSVLNDVVEYEKNISKYRKKIYPSLNENWFDTYIDPSSIFILNDTKSSVLYGFKKELNEQNKKTALSKLKGIINEGNQTLKSSPTFYDPGTYIIEGKKHPAEISVNIKSSDLTERLDDPSRINYKTTYTIRKGSEPTPEELSVFEAELKSQFAISSKTYYIGPDGEITENEEGSVLIKFGNVIQDKNFSTGSFLAKLGKIENTFKEKRETIEKQLSEALAKKIISSDIGLGFNPTINNVMAVICANAEAFYRLMDETHTAAWNVRTDPNRLSAIIPPEKSFSVDGKNMLDQVTVDGLSDTLKNTKIVYPWPQYFEEEVTENGDAKYTLKYPGQPQVINTIKGWDYTIWPEIQFVEEYLTASLERDKPKVNINYGNDKQVSKYIGVNAVEFPFESEPYVNEEYVSFFYEIFERTYLSSNYSKVIRDNNFRKTLYNVLADFESVNIKEGLNNSPELMKILKEFGLNASTFNSYLSSISNNGQGSFWARKSRDIYTQDYIKGYVDIDFGIYSLESMSTSSTEIISSVESVKQLEDYITGSSSNSITLMDVFPFNNLSWLQKNTSKGVEVGSIDGANSTTDVMNFNILKKSIATFDDQTDKDERYLNRYLTYFQYEKNKPAAPNQNITNSSDSTQYNTNDQVKSYYNNRENKDFYLTESPIDYGTNYDGATNNLTSLQTTSLLNTPYFINGLLKGVSGETFSEENAYVGLGYLYLNSLPLPTLSEKYLTRNELDSGVKTTKWGDYFYAGLSKFAAIHKIPYLWLLKYGSVWHRYKEDKKGNGDILKDIWKDFNYVNAYDPITNNINKVYNVQNYTGGTFAYVPQKTEIVPGTIPNPLSNVGIPVNFNYQFTKNGFYPQVVNDTYKFFTGKSPLITYSSNEIDDLFNNGNFKLGQSQTNFLPVGYDQDNVLNTLTYSSYFQYYDIEGNTSFDVEDSSNKLLIIPSSGYLKFVQSQRECLNSQGHMTENIDINNKSIQNGNVRPLWGASNFGYFDNQWIKKPKTNEYIKYIDNEYDEQNAFNLLNKDSEKEYKSIEEIFAIFSKEMLDEFEKHFLNFCKKEKDYKDMVFNPSAINDNEYLGSFNVEYNYNIERVMKSLLIVEKPELSNNSEIDVKKISDAQLNNFVNLNNIQIAERDIILKIGNPGRFNRRVFNSFSTNESIKPIEPINFDLYVEGTVPTSTNSTTVATSKGLNPEAWDALYEYVGDYIEENMRYSDDGSFVTDFFPTMDIRFTEENVRDLSQIIKVFATQKYNNNNLTSSDFQQTFESFLSGQITYQNDMLNQIFRTLNKTLPSVKVNPTQVRISKLDGNTIKNDLWSTFKTFNDRWISGQDVKNKTLFEQFLFMDKANRPIGDKVVINIEDLRSALKTANSSASVLSLLGTILEKNNFIFMPTPSYSNFYGRNLRVKEGMPDPSFSDIGNNTFGTFLEVDTHGSEPKFLAIYVGKVSETINTSPENDNYLYGDDSFDITKPALSPLRSSEDGVTNFSNRNKVVAFNVDFGVQNQQIFKSISIDMAQRKNIAPTFQILSDMGSMADGQKVSQETANLYNFYKNASYNCSVTSMGNVMIQPTMYFNLRYVPMFYGPYLITSVTHDITTRDFQTSFEGVRATKYSLQMPDGLISSVNRDIVQNYLSEIRRIPSLSNTSGDTLTRSNYIKNSSTTTNGKRQAIETKCVAVQQLDKPYVPLLKTELNQTQFKGGVQQITLPENVQKFIFGVGYVETGVGKNLKAFNNNYFNLKNMKSNARWTVNFNQQTCVKDGNYVVPYLSFENAGDSIEFMSKVCNQFSQIIDAFLVNSTINGDLAKSFTYLWYYTFRFTTKEKELNASSNVDDSIIAAVNHDISTNTVSKQLFDKSEVIFKTAINAWG